MLRPGGGSYGSGQKSVIFVISAALEFEERDRQGGFAGEGPLEEQAAVLLVGDDDPRARRASRRGTRR